MHLTAERYETATDLELVRWFQGGDVRAFEAIYNRYHPAILRLVFRKTRPNYELAEDIAADTLTQACKSIGSIKDLYRGGLSAWLTTIALNKLKEHWKLAAVRRCVYLDDDQWRRIDAFEHRLGYVPTPEDVVVAETAREDRDADLARALARLADRHQACLKLRFFEGLSVLETAKIMGTSEGGVKMTQARALDNLRRIMQESQAA